MILQDYGDELISYEGKKWRNTVYINRKNVEKIYFVLEPKHWCIISILEF